MQRLVVVFLGLSLADGVHPNAAGVRALVAHSMPLVEKAIRTRLSASGAK